MNTKKKRPHTRSWSKLITQENGRGREKASESARKILNLGRKNRLHLILIQGVQGEQRTEKRDYKRPEVTDQEMNKQAPCPGQSRVNRGNKGELIQNKTNKKNRENQNQ